MTTIKLKNGSGAPTAGDLVQGEPALDLTNKRLYTEDSGGTVIEVGTNPTSITTGDITATGLIVNSTGVLTLGEEAVTSGYLNAPESLYVNIDSNNNDVSSKFQIGTNATGIATNVKFTVVDDGTISFYNSAGTSQDFYWDASTSRLGLGTTSPNSTLEVSGTSAGGEVEGLRLTNSSTTTNSSSSIIFNLSTASADSAKIEAIRTNSPTSSDTELAFSQLRNGTLEERVRIDSTGNVGIGTDSPSGGAVGGKVVHVQSSGETASVRVDRSDASTSGTLSMTAGNTSNSIYSTGSKPLALYTNSTEAMRIDSSGNLLVGKTSASSSVLGGEIRATGQVVASVDGSFVGLFNRETSDGEIIRLKKDDTTVGSISTNSSRFEIDGSGNPVRMKAGTSNIQVNNNTHISFDTAGSEAARFDSSGNLLVGKTASSIATEGVTLGPNGQHYFTSDNETALKLNRLTTDGEIIQLRKDGAIVGSIGTGSGALFIGGGDTNLTFNPAGDNIYPSVSGSTSVRDGAVDLGASSARFKDLYLSGGAYLGGTAAANHLDDYEEGTFTPVYAGVTTNPTVTHDIQSGFYTKIGRQVFCQLTIRTSAVSSQGSGQLKITGLPFAATNTSNQWGLVNVSFATGFGTDNAPISGYVTKNTSEINLLKPPTADIRDGLNTEVSAGALGTAGASNYLILSVMYTA